MTHQVEIMNGPYWKLFYAYEMDFDLVVGHVESKIMNMTFACNRRLLTGHRPGSGSPSPVTTARRSAFLKIAIAGPRPHQSSPRLGRRRLSASAFSSDVPAMDSGVFVSLLNSRSAVSSHAFAERQI